MRQYLDLVIFMIFSYYAHAASMNKRSERSDQNDLVNYIHTERQLINHRIGFVIKLLPMAECVWRQRVQGASAASLVLARSVLPIAQKLRSEMQVHCSLPAGEVLHFSIRMITVTIILHYTVSGDTCVHDE
jgi:hypothetical protein